MIRDFKYWLRGCRMSLGIWALVLGVLVPEYLFGQMTLPRPDNQTGTQVSSIEKFLSTPRTAMPVSGTESLMRTTCQPLLSPPVAERQTKLLPEFDSIGGVCVPATSLTLEDVLRSESDGSPLAVKMSSSLGSDATAVEGVRAQALSDTPLLSQQAGSKRPSLSSLMESITLDDVLMAFDSPSPWMVSEQKQNPYTSPRMASATQGLANKLDSDPVKTFVASPMQKSQPQEEIVADAVSVPKRPASIAFEPILGEDVNREQALPVPIDSVSPLAVLQALAVEKQPLMQKTPLQAKSVLPDQPGSFASGVQLEPFAIAGAQSSSNLLPTPLSPAVKSQLIATTAQPAQPQRRALLTATAQNNTAQVSSQLAFDLKHELELLDLQNTVSHTPVATLSAPNTPSGEAMPLSPPAVPAAVATGKDGAVSQQASTPAIGVTGDAPRPFHNSDPCYAAVWSDGQRQCHDPLLGDQSGPDLVVIPGVSAYQGDYAMTAQPISAQQYRVYCALAGTCSKDSAVQHKKHSKDRVSTGMPLALDLGDIEQSVDDYNRYCAVSGRCPGVFALNKDHAAQNVTFAQASEYAQWLSQQTGQTYRLPTEEEWLHAVQAGHTSLCEPMPAHALGTHQLVRNDWGVSYSPWAGKEWVRLSGGAEGATVGPLRVSSVLLPSQHCSLQRQQHQRDYHDTRTVFHLVRVIHYQSIPNLASS